MLVDTDLRFATRVQALARVVHQQVEDEPGVLRQYGVERFRERAIPLIPFDTAVPLPAGVLLPQRIIVIKRDHSRASSDNEMQDIKTENIRVET